MLKPQEIPRIGYIPIALSSVCRNPVAAGQFIAFLKSDAGRAILQKWGYLVSESEAKKYALPSTPVGGVWEMPASWR